MLFSSRKVSTNQAIKVLKRNGIQVNEDQAIVILDFLYLLAKTCSSVERREFLEIETL
jgi:hypothetical protein